MSSKFFTWTKGDRRNATEALQSGGVVPIPVECLKIKGMDYARSAKNKSHRKPLPLPLEQQQDYSTPSHSSRATDSIALHEAAVQSATSLMAVMNDMLRSPQLSAHLSSQRQSDAAPTYARPRSHTAPSTPLVEAPSREPVELPGSLLVDHKKSHLSLPYSTKNCSDTLLVRSHDASTLGPGIARPHSSPQDTHSAAAFEPTISSRTWTHQPDWQMPILPATPSPRSVDPAQTSRFQDLPTDSELVEPTLRVDSKANTAETKRPALSVMQPQFTTSSGFPQSISSSRDASSNIVPRAADVQSRNAYEDPEIALLEEIAQLRASQDAHVQSLKEAHEKELACQRSYIQFLEKRRLAISRSLQPKQQRLTIDTSHSGPRNELYSEASATTLKSFESCFENERRRSQEAVAEVEALKRKLSLCKKAQVDASDIQRERDHLRDVADRSERRIAQLKDIIRKAKDNDRALRNRAVDLEARLEEANNERADVLEGFHDACSQVRAASERERRLAQELDEMRCNGPFVSAPPVSATLPRINRQQVDKPRHGRARSDAGTLSTTPPRMDPTMRQLTEARRMLATKDARIQALEEAAMEKPHHSDLPQQTHVADLERQLEEHKQSACAAQADADRYNSLLHNELRRQAKRASTSTAAHAAQIEDEARAAVTEKLSRVGNPGDSDSVTAETEGSACKPLSEGGFSHAKAESLQKELQHCIGEIIMYKLDVKGYRKDLKKANAEIESLRATKNQPSPILARESVVSTRSRRTETDPYSSEGRQQPGQECDEHDPGLGITVPQPPKTPTKPGSVAAATAAALSSPLASPPPRTKTPLNAHKKLPKPPASSRTPSPLPSPPNPKWPGRDVVRTETLRSLSESIVSSYAKRDRLDSEAALQKPNSDPLGSLPSPRTPAQRVKERRIDSGYAA